MPVTAQKGYLLPAETCLMSVTAQRGIYVVCLDLPDVYYCTEGNICCLLRLA